MNKILRSVCLSMITIRLRVMAIQLWMWENAIEDDIEPLLFKLWKIEKIIQWRMLSGLYTGLS